MSDYRISIYVRNVARGDVVALCEEIMQTHGDDFDAARGEFVVRTSKREGGADSYFEFDWQDGDDG